MGLYRSLSVAALLSSVTFAAQAGDFDLQFTPYLGVDAQQAKWGFKDGFGNNHVPNSAKQGHVYFGAQLHEYVAIELGYEASQKREKQFTPAAGTTLGGAALTADQQAGINHFRVRQSAMTLDLVPQMKIPGHEEISVYGVLGVSRENMNIEYFLSGAAVSPPAKLAQKNKNILRLGAGVKYQFSDNAGVRLNAVWKKWGGYNNMTAPAEVLLNAHPALTVQMRNGYQVGFGVYASI
jgi:opacity protein-like surface antigen